MTNDVIGHSEPYREESRSVSTPQQHQQPTLEFENDRSESHKNDTSGFALPRAEFLDSQALFANMPHMSLNYITAWPRPE